MKLPRYSPSYVGYEHVDEECETDVRENAHEQELHKLEGCPSEAKFSVPKGEWNASEKLQPAQY